MKSKHAPEMDVRRHEVRRNKERGCTLIEAVVAIALTALIGASAAPALDAEREQTNENAAIATLTQLVADQVQFFNNDFDQDGVNDVATSLQELARYAIISDPLGATVTQGYKFELDADAESAQWECTGEPLSPGSTGRRFFFVDQTGVIRASASGAATETSDPIQRRGPLPIPDKKNRKIKAASKAIKKIDKLVGGQGLPAARALLDDMMALNQMLGALDHDNDTQITLMEIAGADIIAMARALGPVVDPVSPFAGDGVKQRKTMDKFSRAFLKELHLGNGEQTFPAVATAGLDVDPAKGLLDQLLL